jgi:hypothetical protein
MGWFSKKNDSNASITVQNDQWNMFIRWAGENRLHILMFFDETYAEKIPDDYNEGVELRLILKQADPECLTQEGMPLPEYNRDLQSREDDLMQRIARAGLHVKYVGRLVGVGGKTYRFQSRDASKLIPVLQQWAGEIPYLAKQMVSEEKKWALYERILPNAAERMQISDRRVIDHLLANGAKEDTMYTLDFNFTGASDKLDIIQKDLEEESFTTAARSANHLQMQRELPLDLETIYECTFYMLMSSHEHEFRYEGWGCRLN